jgi:hypothetical protein
MPARTGTSIRRQATGLTPDLGAARVLLLGYDMWVHGGHILWIGDAPTNTKPVILEHLTLPGFKALAVSRHDRRTNSTAVSASEAVMPGQASATSADEHCRK